MSIATLQTPQGNEWIAVALAYLIGGIPFGYLFARLKGVDLRKIGSGNIGATNTGRALGKPLGFLAFALDFVKGYAPVAWLAPEMAAGMNAVPLMVWCGAAAVVGHCYPAYLGFRGGKGVATGCGAVIALDPMIFALGGVAFLLTAFAMGFMSFSSMAMAVTFAIAAWYQMGEGQDPEVFYGCVLFAVLVVWRHRANVQRLLAGVEPRLGFKKKDKS